MRKLFTFLVFLAFASNSSAVTDTTKTANSVNPIRLCLEDQFKLKKGEDSNLLQYVKAMQLIEEVQVAEEMPEVYPTSAGVYSGGQLNFGGLSALEQSLQLSRKMNDKKYEAEILNAFGGYLAYYGEFDRSIELYRQCVYLSEITLNKKLELKSSISLARILIFKKHYDEALLLENRILSLCNVLRKPVETGLAYLNIGMIKSLQGKTKEAETTLIKKALPILYRWDKNGMGKCFTMLAENYEKDKRYPEAKWFYIQALSAFQTQRNTKYIINSYVNLARVKGKVNENDLALQDYKTAEGLARQINYLLALIQIKNDVGEIYKKTGNLAAAGSTQSEYQQLKNTLLQSGS